MTLDELRDAVQRYYGDTTRSRAETKEGLEEILCDIENLIDSLDDDD